MTKTLIDSAITFAFEKHAGQFRKGGLLPYIAHPMEVMKRIYTYGIKDEKILAAAVAHDLIEDCGVTVDELVARFGFDVAHMVEQLSYTSPEAMGMTKKEWVAGFKEKPPEVLLIKVIDRLANISDFCVDKDPYRFKYVEKTRQIFDAWKEREDAITVWFDETLWANVNWDINSMYNFIKI
jgi:(p)ppGpp synthase/HD superfamily hydrolase